MGSHLFSIVYYPTGPNNSQTDNLLTQIDNDQRKQLKGTVILSFSISLQQTTSIRSGCIYASIHRLYLSPTLPRPFPLERGIKCSGRWEMHPCFQGRRCCKSAESMILEEMHLQSTEVKKRQRPLLNLERPVNDFDASNLATQDSSEAWSYSLQAL